MSRPGFLRLFVALALAATAGSVLLPGERDVVIAVAAGILLGVTALSAVATAWRARPSTASPFESLLPPAPASTRPDDLVHLERLLGWKAYSRAEFDVRVAPVLGRALVAGLKKRLGIDAAADPEGAREVVEPDLWALLDPGQWTTTDESSVTTRDIARVVERIEAL